MDVEATFPAHRESAELMQQSEGLLDDVPEFAEALDSGGLRLGDQWFGATFTAGLAERCTAVGLVSQQRREPAPGPPWPAGDGREAVEKIQSTVDIGHVRAAGQNVDRGAVAVADQVVLGARFAAVDRRRACSGTPFFASM